MTKTCSLAVLAAAVFALTSPVEAAKKQSKTAQAIEFVKLGYGDLFEKPFRSLYFRTDELTTPETQAVIRLVTSYNAFDGKKVAQAIGQFKGRVSNWQFGREGSPVLYVELAYWTHQVEEADQSKKGKKIDQFEHLALVAQLKKVFVQTLAADEFSADHDGHSIRIWWD